MYTTLVTIGRNVGTEPMTDVAWATFQADILDILATAATWLESSGWSTHLAQFDGRSTYDGVAEDSSMFQLLHEGSLEPGDYETIRNMLKLKAREYKQECIALIPACRADLVPPANADAEPMTLRPAVEDLTEMEFHAG